MRIWRIKEPSGDLLKANLYIRENSSIREHFYEEQRISRIKK